MIDRSETTSHHRWSLDGQTQSSRYIDHRAGSPVEIHYRVGSGGTILPASADSIGRLQQRDDDRQGILDPRRDAHTHRHATPLFPFTSPDTVYAGSCRNQQPEPQAKRGRVAIALHPARQRVAPATWIQLPALNLTVNYSGSL